MGSSPLWLQQVRKKGSPISSDNGIYVGAFPTQNGSKEYRVIHAQAIDNVDYGDQEMQDNTRVSYFGAAVSFATLELALEEARFLANKTLEECGLLEYGIDILNFERPILNKTTQEADAWLKKKWDTDFPPVDLEEGFLSEDEYRLVEPPSLPKLKFSELRAYSGMNGFSATEHPMPIEEELYAIDQLIFDAEYDLGDVEHQIEQHVETLPQFVRQLAEHLRKIDAVGRKRRDRSYNAF